MKPYIHQTIGAEVQSVSGFYTITEEGVVKYKDRECLYVLGIAIVGSACCGTGGCRFIQVPGFVVSLRAEKNAQGLWISNVEPPTEEEKEALRRILLRKYPYAQISFPL